MAANLIDPDGSKVLEEIFSKCKLVRDKDGSYVIERPEDYKLPEVPKERRIVIY